MATHSAVERTSFLSEAGKTVGLKSKCPKFHCTSPEFLQHPWYHLILSRVLWPGQRHWEGCASQNVPRSKPWIISCSLFEHIWWHFEWLFKRFCKKAIIRFTTLLWCLAFDLKRFVAFCFFFSSDFSHHLEVCWGSGHHWRPDTFHSGQSSWAKGRAGCSLAQSEDGPPAWAQPGSKHFSTPQKVWILGEFQFLNTKERFRSERGF